MPLSNVNGIDLYYEVHGAGTPVVLVAGFSTDHRAWDAQVPLYAKHHQVIVFDNRGIGRSACPDAPYSTEMMADDAAGLVQALGLSSAHFVGHSFGGCIVQTIAKRHPQLVRSAVISCSFLKASMRLAEYGRLRLDMLRAATPDPLVGRFIATMCLSNAFMALPGVIEQSVAAGPHFIGDIGLKNQLHAVLTFDSREWIGDIHCPTLLIGADEDLLADVADTRFMASAVANSTVYYFEDVGHMPMAEQPGVFNDLVLSFLESARSR